MTSAGVDKRRERRVALRRRLLLVVWVGLAVAIVGRSAGLQVKEVDTWRAEADRQHRMQGEIPAPRGIIRDRTGLALAVSHETYRVSVAPHELREDARATVAERLSEVLQISADEAARALASSRRWVVLPGRYPPSVREELSGTRGVYVERELRRFHPHGTLARPILGAVVDDEGRGGVEQAFEEVLRGETGLEVKARDSQGRPIPGEAWSVRQPRPGGEVVLTLDLDLQEIAREALRDALAETRAQGGHVLVSDPRSGEILAMVSLRRDGTTDLSALHSPYEPGSTLKPFTIAGLLSRGLASLSDSVDTGDGRWTVHGRTITDVQAVGKVTLAHALRVSSNVGIAKLAARLSQEEQYETLRDFGFGVSTGLALPGEASGLLRRPREWSRQSPASLAIGYEIGVTPLQMAMAYGALANGGRLMEPRIVREIRGSDGRTIERFEPRVVREVVPPEVAFALNEALAEAVEDGTGRRAGLTTFRVAGKSGTSRAYGAHGGYERGGYYASFIGFFPADDPQLLVFVKLERPQGQYYGGATAAPVTRATMEAVLAARRPPIDRNALARLHRPAEAQVVPSVAPPAAPISLAAMEIERGASSSVQPALWEEGERPRIEDGIPVPDVRGLPMRIAARRLHAHGLRVQWDGGSAIREMLPPPGEILPLGDTVQLLSGGSGPPGATREGLDE